MEVLLPTTKHRRGRRTARQEAALASASAYLLAGGADLAAVFDGWPVVLDMGFGTGEAVIAYAKSDPATRILAVDMHTPGIGDLLASIAEGGLSNVFVIEADVREVLTNGVHTGMIAGARSLFPDPWPKKRHHQRRLIQPEFVEMLADRMMIGATWHIATDWPDYAKHIEGVLAASSQWLGGRVPRPHDRPLTRFERRGLAAGRQPIDLRYARAQS